MAPAQSSGIFKTDPSRKHRSDQVGIVELLLPPGGCALCHREPKRAADLQFAVTSAPLDEISTVSGKCQRSGRSQGIAKPEITKCPKGVDCMVFVSIWKKELEIGNNRRSCDRLSGLAEYQTLTKKRSIRLDVVGGLRGMLGGFPPFIAKADRGIWCWLCR